MRETEIEDNAQKAKISMGTLRLAKKALGVKSWKKPRGVEPSEDDGAWFWELPESKPEDPPFFDKI